MVKVGIDALAIYTSRYALDLETLAKARGIDPDKYRIGLGQWTMSVPPPGEDIVTMAANAALQVLDKVAINDIDLFLFATESGIDQSKAAGLYVHELLGLPSNCRIIELKQACYSGTAALQLAMPYLRERPNKKVLLIASDIARYGLNTPGESSQGSGAIAMMLSANPRVMSIEPEFGVVAESVMDFWRPNYLHEALVDGKYSSKLYLTMLDKSWQQYQAASKRNFLDHQYFCYHIPVPRLAEKAHQYLAKLNNIELSEEKYSKHLQSSLEYGRKIGNSYTAALYIGLASLLDLAKEDLTDKRIGFYSYGSGCVGEYFSGVVQQDYQEVLKTNYHQELLAERKLLSYEEYEKLYHYRYPEDGDEHEIPIYDTGRFKLVKMQQHKRIYAKVEELKATSQPDHHLKVKRLIPPASQRENIKVFAPGKLILSGEHAVIYGQPALAMAVNRYVTATVTRETLPQILFDLSDLAHHSRLSFSALRDLKARVKRKYHRFISGDFSIREVLQKPFELAQFALGVLAESLNLSLPHGVKIHLQSDIPIGCGMGSSAATVVSVMHAISQYLGQSLSQESLFQLALEAENMQHGRSTGLDLHVALQGGCLYMHGEQIEKRLPPQMPMYLVNTGTPESTTGQCIEKAARFLQSSQLQEEFAAVTKAMDAALKQGSWEDMQKAIRENHRLLMHIGVVPLQVQAFIQEIEASGGAAKICGAGAVAGNHAGAVLVAAPDQKIVETHSRRFGYNIIPISGETRGVHAA